MLLRWLSMTVGDDYRVALAALLFDGSCEYRKVAVLLGWERVFLPVYLFVVVPGRWFRRHEKHPRLQGFVKGATAAAAGAIAGTAIVITGALAAAIAQSRSRSVSRSVSRCRSLPSSAAAAGVGLLLHS